MLEVRRDEDGERCGHVVERDGAWVALTVFGGELGTHATQADAVRQVTEEGLASLAERWQLRGPAADGTDDAEVVCIVEADAGGVTVALGYYSMPGVPTLRIAREQLEAGEWHLFR